MIQDPYRIDQYNHNKFFVLVGNMDKNKKIKVHLKKEDYNMMSRH